MGLRFIRRRDDAGKRVDSLEWRFNAYFPRAFAYVYSNLGDESSAREVVGAGFSAVLSEHPSGDEEAFRISLFGTLRGLCREHKRKMPLDIGLGMAERDVITLTFDAGLTSWEVDLILGVNDTAVELSSALERMRDTSSPSIIPSFYRIT